MPFFSVCSLEECWLMWLTHFTSVTQQTRCYPALMWLQHLAYPAKTSQVLVVCSIFNCFSEAVACVSCQMLCYNTGSSCRSLCLCPDEVFVWRRLLCATAGHKVVGSKWRADRKRPGGVRRSEEGRFSLLCDHQTDGSRETENMA